MSRKQKIIVSTLSLMSLLVLGAFFFVLCGCSGGGNGGQEVKSTPDETIGANGVRNDIQAYINTTYPDSEKKRTALTSYAKNLQAGYDAAANNPNMTKADAVEIESKKIRALNCLRLLGGLDASNNPTDIVADMTSYSNDKKVMASKIAAQKKYESLFSLAVIPISSPGDTIENTCD